MKTLLSVLVLLASNSVYAVTQNESYVKSVCSAAPVNTNSIQPFVTYYFYIAPSQPYPNAVEIAGLFPARYESFMTACNVDDNPTSGHWATLEYVSLPPTGLRAVGNPCRTSRQCSSNRCSLTTGACLSPIVPVPSSQ